MLFAPENYCKMCKQEAVMKNLAKEVVNEAVDNYFYYWVVLVYLKRNNDDELKEVVKNDVKQS
jgi:hypothetical protein